jgi:hypothetical protein
VGTLLPDGQTCLFQRIWIVGVTIQMLPGYLVGLPLSLTLPAASCSLEKGPRLPGASAGHGLAWRHLADSLATAGQTRLSGIVIAAALSILLAVGPQLYAKPIAQSALDDISTIDREYSGQGDGVIPSAWLFKPPGAPVLSRSTQDLSQVGLNQLPPSAIGWATVSPLAQGKSQRGFSHRETLEQILRSITTVHPQGEPRASSLNVRAQRDPRDQGFSELFLESETAGAALRAVVGLKTVDEHGVAFAILGMDFELNAIVGTHDVMLSDLSNGWSATRSGPAYPTNPTQAANGGASLRPRPSLFRLAVTWAGDFLVSPIGILLIILSGLTLLVWAATSALTAVRGTPSRHRRFRRNGPGHEEATSTSRRKRRIAVAPHRRSRRRSRKRVPQV